MTTERLITIEKASLGTCALRASIRTLLSFVLLGGACSGIASAGEVLTQPIQFDIPAQSVESALIEFSRQADLQVMVESTSIAGERTSGVKGRLRVPDALALLLQDTNLTYQTFENAITVKEASRASRAEAKTKADQPQVQSAAEAATTAPRSGPRSAATPGLTDDKPARARVEEVVVTGTHIRGHSSSAPAIVISRFDIEKTGFSTVQSVIESLPQNFAEISPGGRYATEGGSNLTRQNNDRASSANLRGLGAESTLTLLDGMRQAGSIRGRVLDLSTVPLSIIERVDVVTGGHSAIYGSDAVGGVVNLVTRRDVESAETQLSYGGTQGGGERLLFSQLAGGRFENGGFVVGYEYARDWALDLAKVGLLSHEPILEVGGLQELSLLAQAPTWRHSAFFGGHYKPNDRIELYGNALYTYRRFESTERTRWPDAVSDSLSTIRHPSNQYGASGGALVELSDLWSLRISGSTSVADIELKEATFTDLGFEASNATLLQQDKATFSSISAVVDGPLGSIAGRTPRLALGAEARHEKFDGSQISDGALFTRDDRDRHVGSAFIEVALPILQDGSSGFKHLEVSAAGRYDDYSDFGNTFNPQVGLTWEFISGVSLRGGYAKAFRAPSLVELGDRNIAQLRNLPDPQSATGTTPVLLWRLDNPSLGPEQAETWDVSLQVRPDAWPETTLSLTYFDVKYEDRIAVPAPSLTDQLAALVNQERFPQLINRNPTLAEVQAIIDHARGSLGFRNLTGVPFNPASQSILDVFPNVVVFDDRNNNISIDKVRGIDLSAKSGFDTGAGEFTYGLNATYTLDHERRVTATSAPVSLLNEVGKPVDLRLRANLGWTHAGFGAFMYINYIDGYSNPFSDPPSRLSSWTTTDLTLQFNGAAARSHGLLSTMRIALSAENVFNENPPRYSTSLFGLLYDATNASPFGRYVSLRLTKDWQ